MLPSTLPSSQATYFEWRKRTRDYALGIRIALAVYALLMAVIGIFFSQGLSFKDATLTISGLPLGVDAINFAILYSVLWSGYLERPEVTRRALHSVLLVGFGTAVFLADRAGYIPHPATNSGAQ